MANILELLRDVLTVGDEQRRFASDPHGYLTTHGFGDLSGEDVVEAIRSLRRTLPADVAARLEPYEDGEALLPPVRPLGAESELDAAVRQLQHATGLNKLADAAAPPPPPPPSSKGKAEKPQATRAPAPRRPALAPRGDGVDPYAAFGEELAAIIRHAGQQMEEVLRRAEEQADAIIKGADAEGDSIRKQAEEEAASMRATATEEASAIRAAAEVDAQNLRQNATQEGDAILLAAKSAREEARVYKQSARDEASAILQNARSTQEDAQRQSADLIKSSEREAASMLAEARARRDQIREAERQLRQRLSGVETVFRNLQEGSVVPDEDDEPTTGG
ncbi:MAG: hypothetical protein ACR2LQ_09115 [Acidimicrobiales bacterium]